MKLSVVIITLNEEDRLEPALASCRKIADEFVIVDSYSTDGTLDIARKYGAKIFQKPFDDFSSQKNYATECAEFDWVFHIDADERLSPELETEILNLKALDLPPADAYRIKRRTFYINRWIRHSGWYPDKKIRMYRKVVARWHKRVHEHLKVEGSVKDLSGDLEHYSYRNISDHIIRANRYASIQAEDLKSRSSGYLWLQLIFNPGIGFLKRYLVKLGFLDGFAGVVIAVVASFGIALKYIKALELKLNH